MCVVSVENVMLKTVATETSTTGFARGKDEEVVNRLVLFDHVFVLLELNTTHSGS